MAVMAAGHHAKFWAVGSLVVVLTIAATGTLAWWAVVRGTVRPADVDLEALGPYGTVPPFSLTERSGRPVTREDLRGVVWLVDFIYTECTETCPLQSLEFARLQRDFAQAADLRLVSITIDPAHDTPDILRAYAGRYGVDVRWWFLTGDKRAISCLAQEGFHLGVVDPAVPSPPACRKTTGLGPAPAWASHGSGGLVMHSARVVLVDRAGVIRAYHLATDAESMSRLRANLRQLLDSPSRARRGPR